MRAVKDALKTSRAIGKQSTASWAILGPSRRKLDRHATLWDEPERDWRGLRHSNPLRVLRETFRREKFLGTW